MSDRGRAGGGSGDACLDARPRLPSHAPALWRTRAGWHPLLRWPVRLLSTAALALVFTATFTTLVLLPRCVRPPRSTQVLTQRPVGFLPL